MDPADRTSVFSNNNNTVPERVGRDRDDATTSRNGLLPGPGFIGSSGRENQVSLVDKVIDAITKKLAGTELKQVINDKVIDPAFEILLQRSIPYLVVAGICYFVLLLLLIGIFIILIKHSAALKKLSAPLPLAAQTVSG